MSRCKQSTTHQAFTLIELLVVIAIIGLLSSVVLASLNGARTRAQNTALLSSGNEILKMIAACDIDGGKLTVPNSETNPSNDLCTLGAQYGKWPLPPQNFTHRTMVWTSGQENLMYLQNSGTTDTYAVMLCGIYPPWISSCGVASQVGLCRTSSTYSCTRYNRATGVYE